MGGNPLPSGGGMNNPQMIPQGGNKQPGGMLPTGASAGTFFLSTIYLNLS